MISPFPAATRSYAVAGMTCRHCVMSVTEEVIAVPGVQDVSVDLASGSMRVAGESFADEDVRAAVAEAGYRVAA